VDGKSQMRGVSGPYTTDKPLENPWTSTGVCDFLSGSYREGYGIYSGYASGAGPVDKSVAHSRSVIFVKARKPADPEYWIITDRMSGAGKHTYEQLFHLIPVDTMIDSNTKVVTTTTVDQPNLAFIPSVTEGVAVEVVKGRPEPDLQGWYIADTPRPLPAPCVIYRQEGSPPIMFQTVLWPMKAGQTKTAKVEAMGEPGSGWLKITLPDGSIDIYSSMENAGRYQCGSIVFEGLALLLRLDKSGNLACWQLIGGTSLVYNGKEIKTEQGAVK
jgi:hypothetical protein